MKIKLILLKECLNQLPILEKVNIALTSEYISFNVFSNSISIVSVIKEIEFEPLEEQIANFSLDDGINTLSTLINDISSEYIDLKLIENKLIGKSEKTIFELSIIPFNENKLDHILFDENKFISIDSFILNYGVNSGNKLLQKSTLNVSDCMKMYIKSNNTISFESTDVTRMFKLTLNSLFNYESEIKFSKEIVNTLIKILKNSTSLVYIFVNNLYIKLVMQNITIISILPKINIPKFENIISKYQYEKNFIVNRKELLSTLKRLSILSRNNLFSRYFTNLELENSSLKLSTFDQKNKLLEELTINSSIEKIKISLNSMLLYELLNIPNDENVKFYIIDEYSPIYITTESGFEFLLSLINTIR